MFWLFGYEACRILAPQPGIKFTHLREGEVLTTGLLGKSLELVFIKCEMTDIETAVFERRVYYYSQEEGPHVN